MSEVNGKTLSISFRIDEGVIEHNNRVFIAKNVDGVYNADPALDPTAVRFDEIDYDTVLAKHLEVMDFTATSLAMECQIPVMLFALKDPQNIVRAVMGEEVGTIVH